MKRWLIIVLSISYTALHAHVDLIYPQGGESFVANSVVQIEWFPAVEHNTENWDLLISSNGGATWDTLQADIHVDSLTYSCLVPNNASSETRIRVIQDNSGQDYDDQSADFSIITSMIWSGTTNTAWDEASNWETSMVPNSSHPLMVPSTAANFPVITSSVVATGKELTVMFGAEFEVLSGGLLDISGQ